MRVLHVIPSVSPREGGPSVAVKTMAAALAGRGVEVTIVATGGGEQGAKCERESAKGEAEATVRIADCGTRISGISDPGYGTIFFKRNLEPYKVSFGLAKWLRENVAKFDLVHIHALFSFSSTVAARIARRNCVPYIVRPLGVLNRWGMQNRRRLAKAISFRFVELPILRDCAAIHYTSEAERTQAAELDQKLAEQDSAIIPLPVEGSEGQSAKSQAQRVNCREHFLGRFPRADGKRIILFLSRIDPMKGLELLLDAFAIVRHEHDNVALVIAGEGEEGYVGQLKGRSCQTTGLQTTRPRDRGTTRSEANAERPIKEDASDEQRSEVGGRWSVVRGPSPDVIWTGHLSGEMKAAALAAADVFVLPSASENFGIAAAESLAAGVPTIVSEEVALSDDIRRYDAGLVVKRNAMEVAGAIDNLLSDRERAARLAANGRRLVEERYSPEAVGKALLELYSKILRRDH